MVRAGVSRQNLHAQREVVATTRSPPQRTGLAQHTKGTASLAFPELDKVTGGNAVRIKRQLTDQAIAQAAAGTWADAADTNRKILEMGADAEAENRLAKALWELGELGEAREHYQIALALDPTNRIAERNIERLRVLMSEAGDKTAAADKASKAPVAIFVEETGKTGFAMLTDLAAPRILAHVNPGDAVDLVPEGNRLYAIANGARIGIVEPRVAARLLKLLADGNKYSAGITSLGDRDVRIVIREVFQDPRNYGKVSFPTAARSSDLRPYTKGTLLREEEFMEEELEDDEEDEEIEDLSRVLPAEVTGDEAFEEETDELEEP
jgi:tetratricopeptide (TPR) repeat protein